MDQNDDDSNPSPSLQLVNLSRSVANSSKLYRLVNGISPSSPGSGTLASPPPQSPPSAAWFEVRLFYIRISPCATDTVPDHLTLRHVRREPGVSLEINGNRVPPSESLESSLRRDRVDKGAAEVTYVSTDSIRIAGCGEFEVYERENMILCGSLDRLESDWGCNGNVAGGLESSSTDGSRTGWGLDCYTASSAGSSAFFQPKLGVSSPSVEVYIAGCCSSVPVILTKTVNIISPRRRQSRWSALDAIPEEGEDTGKEKKIENEFLMERQLQLSAVETDGYEPDEKFGHSPYSNEEMYIGEDGQLTWFNAGVRVGVGIGLGMCLGLGIGVGLLMRSYQATTRNFRRRFS